MSPSRFPPIRGIPMSDESNGWNEYKRLVVSELDRLDESINKLSGKIDAMREDMVSLKVKMAMIGAAAGVVVSAIVSIFIKVAVH